VKEAEVKRLLDQIATQEAELDLKASQLQQKEDSLVKM